MEFELSAFDSLVIPTPCHPPRYSNLVHVDGEFDDLIVRLNSGSWFPNEQPECYSGLTDRLRKSMRGYKSALCGFPGVVRSAKSIF